MNKFFSNLAEWLAALILGYYCYKSISLFSAGDDLMFQRFGAYGVAAAVYYFLLIKLIFEKGGQDSQLHHQSTLMHIQSREILGGMSNVQKNILEFILAEHPKSEIRTRLEELNSEITTYTSKNITDAKIEVLDELEKEGKGISSNSWAMKLRKFLAVIEAIVLIFATFQWGFGDMWVRWSHGMGGIICCN